MFLKMNLIVLFFLFAHKLAGQNIVGNPSFELTKKCPTEQYQIKYLENWNIGVAPGTSDFFHRCSENKGIYTIKVGIPINSWGNQEPRTGDAYVGISINLNWTSEYLQTKLLQSLCTDQFYYIEFYVSLADREMYGLDAIGAFFSKRKLGSMIFCKRKTPQVRNPKGNLLTDKENWVKISGTFKAEGGEQYLIIGNFWDAKDISYSQRFDGKKIRKKAVKYIGSYYYIDDVKVVPCDSLGNEIILIADSDTTIQAEATIEDISVGETVTLENIFFETDKSELLETSFEELNRLFDLLQKNAEMRIKISGHTDNTGTEQHNKELSEERAVAVLNYLVNKGITANRVKAEGFGSRKPVADNNTEEGRSKNRRVEITVIKK